MTIEPDPVLRRRARIARLVRTAKRIGYGALAVAVIAFAAGIVADFPGWLVTTTVVALVAAIVILPFPIVLGYGVRAADRAERNQRPGTAPRGGS